MERDALTALVATNIETIMAKKGLNAAEVARRLGTNPTVVYDILSGKSKNPRLDTLHKIAVIGLGVPVSSLLYDRTEPQIDSEIVDLFAALPKSERARLLGVVQAYVAATEPR